MSDNSGDVLVTNAVLQNDIKHLVDEVRRGNDKLGRRMAFLEEKVSLDIDAIRHECNANTTQVARLEERQKSTTGILGTWTLVASTVAGILGTVVK